MVFVFFGISVNYTLLQINLHLITTPSLDAHASPFSAYHYHLGPLHGDSASSMTSDETQRYTHAPQQQQFQRCRTDGCYPSDYTKQRKHLSAPESRSIGKSSHEQPQDCTTETAPYPFWSDTDHPSHPYDQPAADAPDDASQCTT